MWSSELLNVEDQRLEAARMQANQPPRLQAVPAMPRELYGMKPEAIANILDVYRDTGSVGGNDYMAATAWANWRREVTSAESHNAGCVRSMLLSLRYVETRDDPESVVMAQGFRGWLKRHGVQKLEGDAETLARKQTRKLDVCARSWRDPHAYVRERAEAAAEAKRERKVLAEDWA